MPEKEPLFYQIVSNIASIVYIVFIAGVAGIIRYMNTMRRRLDDISLWQMIVSFAVGGFNGYLVFLLCDAANWSWQATAFLSGSAGAMGSEALHALIGRARSTLKGDVNDNDGEK